jgi:hypothetical protein
MKTQFEQEYLPSVGEHLKRLSVLASFGGLFLSLSGTSFIWAGTDTFNCSTMIWKVSLALNLFLFSLTWLAYLPFRNTDRLLGNGLLSIFMLLSLFWLFGFSMFYFYLLFAPISILPRTVALVGVTTMLLYRAYVIIRDIEEAFRNKGNLFGRMYCHEGTSITFNRKAIGLLEKARRDRNPFKSVHFYVAMLLTPFSLSLDGLLAPILGSGHGVFIALAFLSIPILFWGVEIFVQTIITMIYYPIKLQQETGKPVLLKDW